jgi:hypothetical protein
VIKLNASVWKLGESTERAAQRERGGNNAAGQCPASITPTVATTAPPACAGSCRQWESALMKAICKHCGGTEFRLLTGVDGKAAAECLTCGKASSFDQLQPSSPSTSQDSCKPDHAKN